MGVVGNLVVRVGADTRQLSKGLTDAQRAIDKAGKQWDKAMKPLAFVGTAFKAVAASVAAAVAGMTVLSKQAIEAADRMDELSNKTGLSVERLQELEYASTMAGSSFDAVVSGASRFTLAMRNAITGSEAAKKVFTDLGISLYNQDGSLRNIGDAYIETIKKLADMQDGTQQAFYASQLFGKGFAEMLPLLKQGSAGISQLVARAHELGIVFSGDQIAAVGAIADQFDELKLKMRAAGMSIAIAFQPMLEKLFPVLLDVANAIAYVGTKIGNFLANLFGLQTSAAQSGDNLAKSQFQLAQGYNAAGKAARGALASFDEINQLQDTASDAEGPDAGGGGDLPVDDQTPGIFTQMAEKVTEMTAPLTGVTDMVKAFFGYLEEHGSGIASILAGVATGLAAWKIYTTVLGLPTFLQGVSYALVSIDLAMRANPIGVLVTVLAALAGALTTAYLTNENFRNSVNGMLARIGEWYQGFKDAGWNIITSIWEGISNRVAWFKQGMANMWQGFRETVYPWLGHFWNAGWELITSIWNGVAYRIEWFTGLIGDFVQGIISHIRSYLGVFWNVGWDIVTGIWNGVQYRWDAFVDWVTGGISNLVDRVKNFLGIRSPSKVFAEIGENMSLGLSKGIDDAAANVDASITHTVSGAATIASQGTDIGDTVANAVSMAMMQAAQFNAQPNSEKLVTLTIDGATLARIMLPYLTSERNRLGIATGVSGVLAR